MYWVFSLLFISSFVAAQDSFYIRFERSGGFAGILMEVEIDSKSLSTKELKELQDLIDKSGFFELKNDTTTVRLPDQFRYKITIDYKGKRQTHDFVDSAVPGSCSPLINYLLQKTRNGK